MGMASFQDLVYICPICKYQDLASWEARNTLLLYSLTCPDDSCSTTKELSSYLCRHRLERVGKAKLAMQSMKGILTHSLAQSTGKRVKVYMGESSQNSSALFAITLQGPARLPYGLVFGG